MRRKKRPPSFRLGCLKSKIFIKLMKAEYGFHCVYVSRHDHGSNTECDRIASTDFWLSTAYAKHISVWIPMFICFIPMFSHFGTWPVGMLAQSQGKAIMHGPVCNGSQVIGWHTDEISKRFARFHADSSGFAFNSTILWDPERWHRPTSDPIQQLGKDGFQVSTIIFMDFGSVYLGT